MDCCYLIKFTIYFRLQDGLTEKMIRNVTLYVVGYIQEFSPDISTDLENSFMTIE